MLLCGGALVTVFLMQAFGLEPCPLCWLQRLAVLQVLLFGLLGLLSTGKAWVWTGWWGAVLGVLIGAALALRHLWLQQLPADEVPSCLPDVGWLLETLSPLEMIWAIIAADGDCAQIDLSILGVSIPGMMLLLCLACAASLGCSVRALALRTA
ncbi:MAG: disulfide bond formation protein B [Gammaproteobacteria bacterium AqS3]|nr:disulfide bond formation protein B [Gammaproteobacteria bacterium AqS3]